MSSRFPYRIEVVSAATGQRTTLYLTCKPGEAFRRLTQDAQRRLKHTSISRRKARKGRHSGASRVYA